MARASARCASSRSARPARSGDESSAASHRSRSLRLPLQGPLQRLFAVHVPLVTTEVGECALVPRPGSSGARRFARPGLAAESIAAPPAAGSLGSPPTGRASTVGADRAGVGPAGKLISALTGAGTSPSSALLLVKEPGSASLTSRCASMISGKSMTQPIRQMESRRHGTTIGLISQQDRRHSAVMERVLIYPRQDEPQPASRRPRIARRCRLDPPGLWMPDARVALRLIPAALRQRRVRSDEPSPAIRAGIESMRPSCGRPIRSAPSNDAGGPPHQADRDEYPVHPELPMLYPGPVARSGRTPSVRDAAPFVWLTPGADS